MSNSPLVVYTKLSPNHSGKRTKKIDTITIHCMAGNCSVETCGNLFASSSRQASSNYGIGTDGRIALYVDEANRSWCTSSNANDQRAVTIEVANNGGAPDWPVSAKAYAALLDLVTDICKRNGIKRLVWSTRKNDRVNHLNGCNMTVHRDYANKSCPGDYLYNRHGQIAAEVNKRLGITDAGGSTGGQTSGNTETGLKVGDVVNFKGTQHYTSAAAKDAKTCKPGKAAITAIAAGKAHPYHLKAVSGGGSTVYGCGHLDRQHRHGHELPRADDGRRAKHPQGPRHQLRRRRPDQGQGHLHHRRRSRRPRRDQVGQAQERRGLDLSGLRHETLKPHRKAETRPEIPGGLFLLCRALLLGVRIRRFTGSGELGLCGLEPQHTALGVIETAEQDGENIDQPADPAGPGRQQPDDACAGFPDIEPMDTEEAEEDAQQQRHRLIFRGRRPLRCGDADRALLRAGLPAGARRI